MDINNSSVNGIGGQDPLFGGRSGEPANLQIILEAIPSAVALVNTEGRFAYVNKRGRELYGVDCSGSEMDRHIFNVKALRLDGTPFPLYQMPVSQTLKSGQTVRNVEMIIQNLYGIRIPVNVSSAPLYDADNKISGAIVTFDDFSERKKKDKKLSDNNDELAQQAEDKYRMLFNSIDQGFFLIDIIFDENDKPVDMYYVEANAAATKMLGSDFTGRRLRKIDSNYEEYWFEIFGKVALTGESVRMEQYAEPDKKWYSFYIFRVGDEKSRRIGNIFMDITERKRTEDALKDSVQLYRTLFENTDDGFVLVQPIYDESGQSDDYIMVEVNQAWERQTGLKAADLVGRTIRESLPDVEMIWPEKFANVAKSGESVHFESFNLDSNRWYDIYAFNYQKGLVGVLFRDVSECKQAEEAVRQSEGRLRALMVASASVVYRMNPDWSSMTELYGKGFLADTDEPDVRWLDEYIHPEDQEYVTGVINECVRERKMFELEHRVLQADGSVGWTLSRAIPLLDGNGEITEWFGAASDITARKNTQEALRESEERQRLLLGRMDQAVVIVEKIESAPGEPSDYRYIIINPAFENQTGFHNVVGKKVREVIPNVEQSIMDMYDGVLSTRQRVQFEAYVSELGQWFQVESFPMPAPGQVAIVHTDITEDKRRELHQAMLSEISRELVGLNTITETMDRLSEKIGRYFGVVWAMYSELIQDNEYSIASLGWNADSAISLKGTYRMRDFLTDEQLERNNAGVLTIVSDTQTDPRVSAETYGALGIRSFIILPISRDGQWRFQMSIIDTKPREWRDDEVDLLREIADRIWMRLERARAEAALRERTRELEESNRQRTDILESISDCFYALDKDLRFTYVNKGAEEIWGLSRADLLGRKIDNVFTGLIDISVSKFHQVLQEQTPQHYEVFSKVAQKWGAMSVYPTLDGISVYFRDTTERKRAEEVLRESEEKYRTLFNSMDQGFCIIEEVDTKPGELSNYRYILANPAFEKITGTKGLVGKTILELFPNATRANMQLYDRVMETGEPVSFEAYTALNIWVAESVFPVDQPNYKRIAVLIRDITERKKAEKELHESEEKFRVAQEHSPDGFTILRPARDANRQIVDFTWVYQNTAIARLSGTDPKAVVGRRLLELFPGHRGTPFLEAYLHVAQTGESRIFEAEYGLETMSRPTWFRIVVVRMNEDIAILAQDITERTRLEQKLEGALHVAETNRLILEAVIQQMPAGIMLTNAAGSQVKINAAMDTIWRCNMEANENISSHVFVAYHRDGRQYKPEEWPLIKALVNDEVVIGEEMSIFRGDGTIGTLLCSSAAIKDKSGATVAGIVIDSDITELRQAQDVLLMVGEKTLLIEKEKNETLRRTMEMKDEFLMTITHEFKTPLSVINSALQTMEMTCAKDLTTRMHKYHNVIKQNSNRQLRLVNNLLDITRMGAGHLRMEKNNVDIVALTKSIVGSIAVYSEQKGLVLSFASTMNSKIIGLDKEKYERILLNLLSNAVKFTPAGQSIAVDISRKTGQGKKWVCIRVKDTGVGIPKDKKELVFEKFGQVGSTRTRQAEGTGIGLHLVKLLVELLGGEISLESQVGAGSTFTVLLPDEKTKEPEVQAGQMTQEVNAGRLIEATTLEFSDFQVQ